MSVMFNTCGAHLLRLVCRGLLSGFIAACSAACSATVHGAQAEPRSSPPVVAPAALEPRVDCGRVPRAARIYTGFTQDVPPEQMYVALEVIRPLEDRLGELFCAPEHADCRPPHLTNIELADALPSSARVSLEGGPAWPGTTHELVLSYVAERWEPEPSSLAEILRPCRASRTSATKSAL